MGSFHTTIDRAFTGHTSVVRIFLHLKPASVEFAEDLPAAGRCKAAGATILQVLANAVPPPGGIKSALPEGKLFSKIPAVMASFKLIRIMQAQPSHNLLILKS